MPITLETSHKPAPPPRHAARYFRSTLLARDRSSRKPAALSVANIPQMASLKQDSVTEDGHLQAESTEDAAGELSAVVDELLDGLSTKFSTVSAEIFAKMDEMSRRLDNLEATILAGDDSHQPKQ